MKECDPKHVVAEIDLHWIQLGITADGECRTRMKDGIHESNREWKDGYVTGAMSLTMKSERVHPEVEAAILNLQEMVAEHGWPGPSHNQAGRVVSRVHDGEPEMAMV